MGGERLSLSLKSGPWKVPRPFPVNDGTRLASKSTFVFPKVRTNYGKFNIGFFGPKLWNEIDEQLKTLSFPCFKRELKKRFVDGYIININ